jgi:hypothetical protein
LLWARRGGDGEFRIRGDFPPPLGTQDVTTDVTVTLDYVDIPVLGVLTFPMAENTSIRFLAGPVLGFNSKAEAEVSLIGPTEDLGDIVKSVDVQGLLGAGLVLHFNRFNVVADGRYAFGFSSIDDETDLDIKNAGFTILAGVGVPLNP